MTKKKELKPLYIEDLGQVQGGKHGRPVTTLALGEEGGATTLALGEEATTNFYGEEGGATTLALGEEDVATTLALGEEDGGV